MKHDLYAMMDCSADYHRAVADLNPGRGRDWPSPSPGRPSYARLMAGRYLIIEDVRQNKPQYKDPDKFWVRVGVVWATHLDTQNNIPASAYASLTGKWRKPRIGTLPSSSFPRCESSIQFAVSRRPRISCLLPSGGSGE